MVEFYFPGIIYVGYSKASLFTYTNMLKNDVKKMPKKDPACSSVFMKC